MSVTNESPKHEAINFINQQSQTPAESVCGAKIKQMRNSGGEEGGGWGGGPLSLSGQILITIVSLCLTCLHFSFFFLLLLVCHGVAYCSDVYANEPELTDEDRWA